MLASEISRSLQLDEVIREYGSECLSAFARTLEASPESTIESFLTSRPPEDRSALSALVAIELRHRLSIGQSCRIEDYLSRFPELGADGESVLDLIYAEYCARRQQNDITAPQEYYKRFPNLHNSLERLFRIDSLFGQDESLDILSADLTALPEAGDTFLEFQLESELGRGASGRVFLAEQTSLSNRRVVLKITSRRTIEHRTLARMEHPNIVPVLSVHYDELTGLQAVCMPYQCAVALSDVCSEWSKSHSIPARGDVFLKTVTASIPPSLLQKSADGTGTAFPAGQDFVHTCAWIMYKLAGALHHAHLRQICHRDIKPSNVLLTAAGQPLLVDFNLSFDRIESGGDAAISFGGTLPYMPPEQILALHPIEQGRAEDVGPLADIYSLAATIFELLTGRLPYELPPTGVDRLTAMRAQFERRYAGVPSASALNSSVPVDLDALLVKCLDPVPHKRYESAAQLAEDLQRFLLDRPLCHVQMTPWHLRCQKFMRRNARRLAIGTFAVVAMITGLMYMGYIQGKADRERQARDKAETEVQQLQTSAQKEADEALSRLPTDAHKYVLLGHDYYVQRRYGHAIHCFNRAIELRPDYGHAYFYRGRCFANLDKDGAALADLTKSIECNPDDMQSYLMRAMCYATSKTHSNSEQALADITKGCELLPRNFDDNTRIVFMDIARIYSAVSRILPTASETDKSLHLAEKYLLEAIYLGLSASAVLERNKSDRFRMLDPVLDRPKVRRALENSGEGSASFRQN
jgi:serine/threonine protein kinase